MNAGGDRNSEARREEAIEPIRRGPVTPAPAAVPGSRRRVSPTLYIGLVLAILLFAVYFVLPGWVAPDVVSETPQVTVPVQPPEEREPTLTAEQLAELQARSESALAEVLEVNDRLIRLSAPDWAGARYVEFDAIAADADAAFLDDDFQSADGLYSEALAIGNELLERSQEIMAAAIAAGDAALAAGEADQATEQFQLVLAVDPQNEPALAGIERARVLPELLNYFREAERARQDGQLIVARDGYRSALQIDPDWAAARSALDAVTAAIAEAAFERQLSAGFAALTNEAYGDAIDGFSAALSMRPGHQAAVEGLAQAEQGQKLEEIALAEIRAVAFERRELWDEAIARYEAALATDATLAFAVEGLARSTARSDLDRKLVNLIDNPRLLLDDELLDDARTILAEAQSHADSGERIAAQSERLAALLEAATRPVTVQLRSDMLTEVTLYRIGPLGSFTERTIELRPGTYTAVGSRRGYRDVRQTFTVLPGRSLAEISVVCIEPIGG